MKALGNLAEPVSFLQPISTVEESHERLILAAQELRDMADLELTPYNITSMIFKTTEIQERLLQLEN